ncbi:hypothetical protein JTB14_005013 [Gonioctena quinquepunctata]|nr:hypothetical protein JTB14_005013 [Gonioctena quinquepunctata]
MENHIGVVFGIISILVKTQSQYLGQNHQAQGYPYALDGQQIVQPVAGQPYTSMGMQYGGPYNGYVLPQQTYYVAGNPPGNPQQGQFIPYPYQYSAHVSPLGGQGVPVGSQVLSTGAQNTQVLPTTESKVNGGDPYLNVKAEMIDVDPAEFRRLMYEQNFQPRIMSYETRSINNGGSYALQPQYIIKTENKQYNNTAVPESISKHEVQSKVTSFNKTFVIHPNEDGHKVINLNFVNGVQVTDAPEGGEVPAELRSSTEETTVNPTTTLPTKGGKRFIDVPEGCAEGMGFAVTGGCFDPFRLPVNTTRTNTTR